MIYLKIKRYGIRNTWHIILDLSTIDWIHNFENCILLRHPKEVISSYTKKNKLNSVEELGYPQQYEIVNFLKKIINHS